MTIIVWPVDAIAGVPSNTGRMLREAQSVYMAGASATDPFGVRSGVRPGTSPTTVTATSTTWTVGAHAGVVDLQPAVEASGYCYAVNATGGLPTGPVTAANATYPRHDVVYAHLDDPAESDGSSVPAVTFTYLAGTVLTAGTLEVSAVPARSVAYATISVPISGGGAPTVIWTAPYTVAAGGILPVPAGVYPATPYTGQYVDDATLGLMRYDGTVWTRPSAGFLYGEYDPGATVTNTVGFNVDTLVGTGVTFTLTRIRRVRVVTRCRFFSSSAGQIEYLRSHVIAGSTAVVAGSTGLGIESQTLTPNAASTYAIGVTTTHEQTIALNPGTYTAFPVGGSTTGATSSFVDPYTAVYDAGTA